CRRGHDVLAHGRPRIVTVEQPEMSKWAVIWLLVHHPLFDFNQTIVGPFDFLQYLLCVWVSFAVCALTRTIRSFDVLTKAQCKDCICSGFIALHCLQNKTIDVPERTSGSCLSLSKSFTLSSRFTCIFVRHPHLSSTKKPLPFEQGPPHSLERLRYRDNSQFAIRFQKR